MPGNFDFSRHLSLASNNVIHGLSSEYLELIILPTEQCNFRCLYCYEDFNIGRMKNDVVLGVKNLIAKRASSLGHLNISWFGGEPLLAKKVIHEISQHALLLSARAGFTLTGSITTNGYLLDSETFEGLIADGISGFQITLDGLGTIHDSSRKRADGRGTFERIWSNLLKIKESKSCFNIMIRLHFTPATISRAIEAIEYIDECFGDDKRFEVLPHSINELTPLHPASIPTFKSESEKAKVAINIATKVSRLRVSSLSDNTGYVCYAAKMNSFVIRSGGEINKCTVALSNEANNVGRISSDGSLIIDNEKILKWTEGLFSLDQRMLACPNSVISKSITYDLIAKS